MRILVTGMRAIHVGKARSDSPLVLMVCDALRRAGHEVDIRPLEFEELLTDFKRYHRVLVWLAPITDLPVANVLDALCLLHQRPDAIVAIDDWQISKIWCNVKSALKYGDKYLFDTTICQGRRHSKLLTDDHKERIRQSARDLLAVPYRRKLLMPIFPWGNWREIDGMPEKIDSVVEYDPTPLLPPIKFKKVVKRRRAWTFAALGDRESWFKKLQLGWPIERLGYPEARVEESAIVQNYAETRGMLVPRYRHCRSGWWRPRYAYAAATKAIAYVADDEVITDALPGYKITDTGLLEKLDDKTLDFVASVQARAFQREIWTTDKFVETVRKAFR